MPGEAYDVVIVGGGPAGSSAAIYAARFDLQTLVIDKGLMSGALGAASTIHNYPGLPGPVKGADILESMRRQAESLGAKFLTDKITAIDFKSPPFQVIAAQETYAAKALILATGATSRSRSIPGEERLVGRGVSYCAICDGAFFRNQAVAVAGSNNEALEEALLLTTFAERVFLLAPTPILRVDAPLLDRILSHPKIAVHLSTALQEIIGNAQVEGVTVRRGDVDEILSLQGVFIYLQGNQPVTNYLLGQFETLENGCLRTDGEMRTSIPGVFAAGDMLCRHVKQAVIAAAEGAMAAIAAEQYLRGRAKARVAWH